jgi:hypothetical protein
MLRHYRRMPARCTAVFFVVLVAIFAGAIALHAQSPWEPERGSGASHVSGEAWLDGFTVSDLDPVKLATAAIIDHARRPGADSART